MAAALTGCAGSGDGLDGNGRPVGEGDPGSGPLTADFASIQAHVFTPICTACHAGGGAPQGLRLDDANSYALLVGVPSTEVPATLRVKPGDPDHSYVIQKLEGHASVGARMPLGGPYLDQATIDVIRQWIVDGAQPAATAIASKKFAVTTVAPAGGASVTGPTPRFVVAFTREPDQTRVDPTLLALVPLDVEAATDGSTGLPLRVSAIDGNARALLVEPLVSLAPGRYALRIRTDALTDVAGQSLAAPAGTANDTATLSEFTVESRP